MHANRNEDRKINSKIANVTTNRNPTIKGIQSFESRTQGGGVFCCIMLIMVIIIVLFLIILLWRIFDIDVLDIGYHQQTNKMRFNITDYNAYHHTHHRPEN